MLEKTLKILLTASLLLGAYSGDARTADKGIGLSVALDYQSTYLWRGTYFYPNGVFFPQVSYNIGSTGLSVSVWAELSSEYLFDGNDAGGIKDYQSTDFGIDYAATFGKLFNLGAGFWYFLMWDRDNSFMYWYVSCGLAVPLNPTINFFHDLYQKEQTGAQYEDLYVQLTLSHDFKLTDAASLTTGAALGYFHRRSLGTNDDGISDIDLSAELAFTKGIVTFTGGFHLVIVPSKDFYTNAPVATVSGKDDIVRYYAKFGVSLAF